MRLGGTNVLVEDCKVGPCKYLFRGSLTDDEKRHLCKCVADAGADYIKTSTGFGTGGATLSDIELFKQELGSSVRIKAAGGIRTAKDASDYIEAGCDRVGASAVVGDINAR